MTLSCFLNPCQAYLKSYEICDLEGFSATPRINPRRGQCLFRSLRIDMQPTGCQGVFKCFAPVAECRLDDLKEHQLIMGRICA